MPDFIDLVIWPEREEFLPIMRQPYYAQGSGA